MKEGAPIPVELTRPTASPRLDTGVIFMAETTVLEETQNELQEVTKDSEKNQRKIGVEKKPTKSTKSPEELWEAWRKALGGDMQNRETKEAVAAAVQLGIEPDRTRKGEEGNPEAVEVFANASLAENARIQKASEILGEVLTPQQQEAILKAHEYGKNGVYELDFSQLREKQRILTKEGGFTKEQARVLIEAGIAARVTPENPTVYDPDSYTDPQAKALADFVNKREDRSDADRITVNDSTLREAHDIAQEARKQNILRGVREPEELRAIGEQFLRDLRSVGSSDEEIRRHLQLYLMGPDLDLLSKDNGEGAMEWLNSQFDLIFQGAASGQELDSPVLRQVESKVPYAIAYLTHTFADRPDIEKRFFAAFSIRQKLMIMRVIIGQKNKESLPGAAGQLREHGLLASFGFENQNVRRLFVRMNEKLDDMRLNVARGGLEKKVTAEMVQHMLRELEVEEVTLLENLKKGNPFWEMVQHMKADPRKGDGGNDDVARQREARNAITRSIRTAYDLFISSQREGIIVARGRHSMVDPEGYRSVPSAMFSFLNPETMMWGGWDMKNAEALLFFDRLKIDMADEALEERGLKRDALHDADKSEYGGRLIRDLSPISDFFSGSWRTAPMTKQLEELMTFKILAQPTIEKWQDSYKGITQAQIKDLLNEQPIVLRGVDADGNETTQNISPTDKGLEEEIDALKKKFAKREDKDEQGEIRDAEVKDAEKKGKELAKQFGLFIQLRNAGNGEDMRINKKDDKTGEYARDKARDVWQKIAKSKPEEIIRILRDRLPVKRTGADWHDDDDLGSLEERFVEILGLDAGKGKKLRNAMKTGDGERPFDIFREKYGPIITMLRERAMREQVPRVVNFTVLDAEEQELVNLAIATPGAAGKLMEAYAAMQEYIREQQITNSLTHRNEHVIDLLVDDYRFEDIYNRVISVDDIFQDEIEEPPKIAGLLSVSEVIATDPAGDGLRRTMNDAIDGMAAQDGLYKFIKTEDPEGKMEAAQEYAAAIGNANGQAAIAKAIRFTYGSYLDLTKPYYWLDVVGVKKLPFRMKTANIMDIYGPEAHVMEREEIRTFIDEKLRSLLVSSAGKKELKDKIEYERGLITADELERRKKKYLSENEKLLESLKKRIGVTAGDEIKTKALQVIFFILLAMAGAALAASASVALEESTGGTGSGGGGGAH